MKIAFVIASLSPGGAERVAATLSNQWSRAGCEVALITYEPVDRAPYYPLDATVELRNLGLFNESGGWTAFAANAWRRVRALRRALAAVAPDIVVSFMIETNVAAICAALGSGRPVVVSERIHPAHHRIGRLRGSLRRMSYPLAARIVVQTDDIAGWFRDRLGLRPLVLPNPIDLAAFHPARDARTPWKSGRKQALAVGRLDHQKGFDVLIDAFHRVAGEASDWDLEILGDGPDRDSLEQRVRDHGLTARVRLPGIRRDIAAAYGEADLYLHPARYEGHPNALMEAMACGLPVVAADAPGGARELLRDGRLGVLVRPEDPGGLAIAMARLMADKTERQTLGGLAAEGVRDYDAPLIAARWLELFRELKPEPCAA